MAIFLIPWIQITKLNVPLYGFVDFISQSQKMWKWKKKKYRGSHPFITFLSFSWPQRWHERSSFQLCISICDKSKFLDFSFSTDLKTILQKLQTPTKSAMSFSHHDARLPNQLSQSHHYMLWMSSSSTHSSTSFQLLEVAFSMTLFILALSQLTGK